MTAKVHDMETYRNGQGEPRSRVIGLSEEVFGYIRDVQNLVKGDETLREQLKMYVSGDLPENQKDEFEAQVMGRVDRLERTVRDFVPIDYVHITNFSGTTIDAFQYTERLRENNSWADIIITSEAKDARGRTLDGYVAIHGR